MLLVFQCYFPVFYVLSFFSPISNVLDEQLLLAFQVLVGTGSRTMKIIKIKSLKIYAFGFCKCFFILFFLFFYFFITWCFWDTYFKSATYSHSLTYSFLMFSYRYSSLLCLQEIGSKVCFNFSGRTEQTPWFLSGSSQVLSNGHGHRQVV